VPVDPKAEEPNAGAVEGEAEEPNVEEPKPVEGVVDEPNAGAPKAVAGFGAVPPDPNADPPPPKADVVEAPPDEKAPKPPPPVEVVFVVAGVPNAVAGLKADVPPLPNADPAVPPDPNALVPVPPPPKADGFACPNAPNPLLVAGAAVPKADGAGVVEGAPKAEGVAGVVEDPKAPKPDRAGVDGVPKGFDGAEVGGAGAVEEDAEVDCDRANWKACSRFERTFWTLDSAFWTRSCSGCIEVPQDQLKSLRSISDKTWAYVESWIVRCSGFVE